MELSTSSNYFSDGSITARHFKVTSPSLFSVLKTSLANVCAEATCVTNWRRLVSTVTFYHCFLTNLSDLQSVAVAFVVAVVVIVVVVAVVIEILQIIENVMFVGLVF